MSNSFSSYAISRFSSVVSKSLRVCKSHPRRGPEWTFLGMVETVRFRFVFAIIHDDDILWGWRGNRAKGDVITGEGFLRVGSGALVEDRREG